MDPTTVVVSDPLELEMLKLILIYAQGRHGTPRHELAASKLLDRVMKAEREALRKEFENGRRPER